MPIGFSSLMSLASLGSLLSLLSPVDPVHHLAHPHAALDLGIEPLRSAKPARPVEDGPAQPTLGFAGDHLSRPPPEALQLEVVEAAVDVAEFGSPCGAEEGGADDAVAAGVGVPAHGERGHGLAVAEVEPGAGEIVHRGLARGVDAAQREALAVAEGPSPHAA